MAGGLPRTNSAIRLEVKSCVTETDDCIPLNFETRLLKYGTTSGLVSSNTMLVRPPDEEHPATRPGTASAAVPSPSVFIIVRRSIAPVPAVPPVPPARPAAGDPWVTVRRTLPDRLSLFRHMAAPSGRRRRLAALPGRQERSRNQVSKADGTIYHMKALCSSGVKR